MTHPTPAVRHRPILARAALALTLGLSLSGCLFGASRGKLPVVVNGVSYPVEEDANGVEFVMVENIWFACRGSCEDRVRFVLDLPPDPADTRFNDGGDGERNDRDDEERGT